MLLVKYRLKTWSNVSISELRGDNVFLAHKAKCHSFSLKNIARNKVTRVKELRLCSSQEKADAHLFMQSLLLLTSSSIESFYNTSFQPFYTYRNLRTIHLRTIQDCIDDSINQPFIGQHWFTGCDSVNAFYGKGKKAVNFLLKGKVFSHAFRNLEEQQSDGQLETPAAL